MSLFQLAKKTQAKVKIAVTGPSGSGKTMSSLLLAKGLTNNGKVAVIDTENNSASLYADKFQDWQFFTICINPPYTAQKYLQAMDAAVKEGFDCLIIDSLSHVWASEGGLLQQKEALDSRGGNSYTNWGQITKLYEQLKSKILHTNIHLISTMRSKQEYVMEQNEKGKQAPKKVGLAPIMRDGMEYEFTVVFDVGMDHQFMVSKDRTGLFDGVVTTISEDTGKQLFQWINSAEAPKPVEKPKTSTEMIQDAKLDIATNKQANAVHGPEDYVIKVGKHTGKQLKELTQEQLAESINLIKSSITKIDKNRQKDALEFASIAQFYIDSFPKTEVVEAEMIEEVFS